MDTAANKKNKNLNVTIIATLMEISVFVTKDTLKSTLEFVVLVHLFKHGTEKKCSYDK